MSDSGGAGGTPTAGWYADPNGGSRLRWWDGFAWTEHFHDPMAAQPAAVETTVAPAMGSMSDFGAFDPSPVAPRAAAADAESASQIPPAMAVQGGLIGNYGPAPEVGSYIGGFGGESGWTGPTPPRPSFAPPPAHNSLALPALLVAVVAACVTVLGIVAHWPAMISFLLGAVALVLGAIALRRGRAMGHAVGPSATALVLGIGVVATTGYLLLSNVSNTIEEQIPDVGGVIQSVEASTIDDTVSTSAAAKFGEPIPTGGLVCPGTPDGQAPNEVNTSATCTATLADGTEHSVQIDIGSVLTDVTITWLP